MDNGDQKPSPSQKTRNAFPAWRVRRGVINATDDQLASASHSAEMWSLWLGTAVVIGVALEFGLAIFHPEYDSPLETWGTVIGSALVAIGVAGEIFFAMTSRRCDSELTRRSDAKVAQADERAAEALERAAKAELELAQIKLPRTIKPDQHTALVAALKERPKGIVHVRPARLDAEASAYGRQIEAVLSEAGFDLRPWPHGHSMSWSVPGAFLIVQDLDKAPAHAVSIQQCFEAAGIVLLGEPGKDHPEEAVSIAIGARP